MGEPEALLKKVRKIDANRVCPNCGTPSPTGLGFGNVCMKFKTFVCDNCKTSHQAISHRCKSVSMSAWTMEEVQSLTIQKGGGNEMACKTWLARAPSYGQSYPGGYRPKQGDRIDIFKQFVVDCYESRKFYSDYEGAAPISPTNISQTQQPSPTKVATSKPQPQTFDAFGTSNSTSTFDAFGISSTSNSQTFDAFGLSSTSNTQPTTTTTTNSTNSNSQSFDAFGISSNSNYQTTASSNSFSSFTEFSNDKSTVSFDSVQFTSSTNQNQNQNFGFNSSPQPPIRSTTESSFFNNSTFDVSPPVAPPSNNINNNFVDPFANNDLSLLTATRQQSAPTISTGINTQQQSYGGPMLNSSPMGGSPLGGSPFNSIRPGVMNNMNMGNGPSPFGGANTPPLNPSPMMGISAMGGPMMNPGNMGMGGVMGMGKGQMMGGSAAISSMGAMGTGLPPTGRMQQPYGGNSMPNNSFDFIGSAIKRELPPGQSQPMVGSMGQPMNSLMSGNGQQNGMRHNVSW